MSDSYRQEVIDPGDRASQMAKDISFDSHGNCPAVIVVPHQPGNFRGPVGFTWVPHITAMMAKNGNADNAHKNWLVLEEVENDGAGGKPTLFSLMKLQDVFFCLPWEILAMTLDDFARSGRLPCLLDNEINVKRLTDKNFQLFEAMMRGFGVALAKSRIVNITGEIAVMKFNITSPFDTGEDDELILTWGASCVGLANRTKMLPLRDENTGESLIRPYQPIVGFKEYGYRCNGGTFFINLIKELWGTDAIKIRQNPVAMDFVRRLCSPSISYAKSICRVHGWLPDGHVNFPLAKIVAIAHITGGGVWGKFGEILPPGIGAKLDTMTEPAQVLLDAQKMSWETPLRLTDQQAYGTLHGGCGMLVICEDDHNAKLLIEEVRKDGIDAEVVGHTTESPINEILITSRFLEGKILSSKNLPK